MKTRKQFLLERVRERAERMTALAEEGETLQVCPKCRGERILVTTKVTVLLVGGVFDESDRPDIDLSPDDSAACSDCIYTGRLRTFTFPYACQNCEAGYYEEEIGVLEETPASSPESFDLQSGDVVPEGRCMVCGGAGVVVRNLEVALYTPPGDPEADIAHAIIADTFKHLDKDPTAAYRAMQALREHLCKEFPDMRFEVE